MAMQDNVMGPLGLRFAPTEKELLLLLKRKVDGSQVEFIPEANVYETEPSDLLAAHAHDRELELFCLTKLKKKCTRVGRQTGGGKWNNKSTKPITMETVSGRKKYFVYQTKDRASSESNWIDTPWRMHEYSLPDGPYSSDENEWVICKIWRSERGSNSSGGTDEQIEESSTSFDPNRDDEVEHMIRLFDQLEKEGKIDPSSWDDIQTATD